MKKLLLLLCVLMGYAAAQTEVPSIQGTPTEGKCAQWVKSAKGNWQLKSADCGGGGGSFDPTANIDFTGNNTTKVQNGVRNCAKFASLQACLDDAGSGGNVYIPAGIYPITTALHPYKGQVIQCAGGDLLASSGARIQPVGAIWAFSNGSPSTSEVNNVSMYGCIFDLSSNSSALGAINLQSLSFGTYIGNSIYFPATGSAVGVWIDAQYDSSGYGSYSNILENTFMYGSTADASGNSHTCYKFSTRANQNQVYGGSCVRLDKVIDIESANGLTIQDVWGESWGTYCINIADDSYNSRNQILRTRCEPHSASFVGKTSPTTVSIGASAVENRIAGVLDYPLGGGDPHTHLVDNTVNGTTGLSKNDMDLGQTGGTQSQMVITNRYGGKLVGINRTPQYALDVLGTIRATNIMLPNPLTIGGAVDSATTLNLKAGSTGEYVKQINFVGSAATLYQLIAGVGTFGLYDNTDAIYKFSSATAGNTVINSPSSKTVLINSTANSGTTGLQVYSGGASPAAVTKLNGDGTIQFKTSGANAAVFTTATLTGVRTYTFPDAGGNVALTSSNITGTAAGITAAYIDWNAVSGGASILNKPATFAPTAHNLLSASHGDTTAASAVRGDGLFAIGATPTWQRLAHSAATGGYFKWNGTDMVASTGAASGTGTPTACSNQVVTGFTLNADAAPTSTCTTITSAFLPTFGAAAAGIVPLSGGGTTNFLRADGTWTAPAGGGTVTNTGGALTSNYVVLGAGTSDTKVTADLQFDVTNKQLQIGQPTLVTTSPISIAGTTNSYLQANIQNKSNGTSASSDWIATADTGTDTTNYIDMGINSSGYTDASYTMGGALDGYLYTNGGNLDIATQTATKEIHFSTGGTLAANQRVKITDTGLAVTGSGAGVVDMTEGAAPSGAASHAIIYADSTSHHAMVNNNNGGAQQLVGSGVDINTSDQVTVTHLASPLPSAQGGTANGFFTVSGPASSAKTFTFPNANATITQTIFSGTVAGTTAAIGAGACGSAFTVVASGVATTDAIIWAPNAAPTASNMGKLITYFYPTSGNINGIYCNTSAASITPTAMTFNVKVVR